MFAVQNLPMQYNMYTLLPLILWWWALSSPGIWIYSFRLLDRRRQLGTFTFAITCFSLGCLSMVNIIRWCLFLAISNSMLKAINWS